MWGAMLFEHLSGLLWYKRRNVGEGWNGVYEILKSCHLSRIQGDDRDGQGMFE